MVDKVITALDYAKREGIKSVGERIRRVAIKHGRHYVEDRTAGTPVMARIDYGRWIADCECGGAEAVDPSTPIFFCVSCGNIRTSGRARPVIFPPDLKAVEAEIMKRPARGGSGDSIDRQITAKSERNWRPG
jgi:hypothetical protein